MLSTHSDPDKHYINIQRHISLGEHTPAASRHIGRAENMIIILTWSNIDKLFDTRSNQQTLEAGSFVQSPSAGRRLQPLCCVT